MVAIVFVGFDKRIEGVKFSSEVSSIFSFDRLNIT